MIEFVVMVVKLLGLFIRKGMAAVENALCGLGSIPPMPPKHPRPGPPAAQKPKPRKYRLVPDVKGTYTLERYNEEAEDYMCEKLHIMPSDADAYIKQLERKTFYYREVD